MVKRILASAMALWALLSFMATFLIIYLPSMMTWLFPDPKGQRLFMLIAKGWMQVWLRLVGCRLVVKGSDHFKKGETYIVTCNHNSYMDPPLSSPFIPGPNKTIAKAELKKIPLFNFYYQKGGILVDRKNELSRKKSYEAMKKVLATGMHMCIYPEGTRNRTNEPLKAFHDGAFRLAVDVQRPIIPAVLLHTKKVLPPSPTFYFWPHRVEIHFLAPIHPQGLSASQLKEQVFTVMRDYYVRHGDQ